MTTVNHYQSYQDAAYASRLYQAGMVDDLCQFVKRVDTGADTLKPWLRQLSGLTVVAEKSALPAAVYHRSMGWQHYMQGQYLQAYHDFLCSLEEVEWKELSADTALGVAKIYTRTGHWQFAKKWLLYYLFLAFQKL